MDASNATRPIRSGSRFRRPSLRQATVVFPSTGERLKKRVTLRNADVLPPHELNGGADGSSGQLLPLNQQPSAPRLSKVRRHVLETRKAILRAPAQFWSFQKSRNGQGVLKCSIAYLLASCAVFFPFFTQVLGTGDGKHLVANIVVWYHPARSAGSMEQGTMYACLGFLYSAITCSLAMGIASWSAAYDNIVAGHFVILVVCCGTALGFIAYVKQVQNKFLVNMTVSLTALPIVTTITKDPAIQEGFFSFKFLSQTLRMAIMGIFISTIVCVLFWPVRARKDLRKSIAAATDGLAEMIGGITASFLSGTEDDMEHPAVSAASSKVDSNISALDAVLNDASNEQYLLGYESIYKIEKRLVDCIQELSEDLGGLKLAARMQFQLLAESAAQGGPALQPPKKKTTLSAATVDLTDPSENIKSTSSDESEYVPPDTDEQEAVSTSPPTIEIYQSTDPHPDPVPVGSRATTLASIRAQAAQGPGPSGLRHVTNMNDYPSSSEEDVSSKAYSAASAADIFLTYLDLLGPPMKSLAFTLKHILKELPFGPAPRYEVVNHPTLRTSLVVALEMYKKSRREALIAVYKSKQAMESKQAEVAADFEEVAASCGHFSASLQGLAEHCLTYLDILHELDLESSRKPIRRSWWWLCFWRRDPSKAPLKSPEKLFHMPSIGVRRHENLPPEEKHKAKRTLRYRLWKSLRVFQRDEIRYAVKVGFGAMLLAIFAYIPATKPTFYHWRLEWALSTYMFACAMTIGAANSTTIARVEGCFLGAVLAIVAWMVSRGNPWALAIFGFLVAYGCFYINIVNDQGPMARFILLTYNLSALYSYSLSINDQTDDEDEGGPDPYIWEIAMHRFISIAIGCIMGLIITRAIWPIVARRKLRSGLSLLWLRMGLIWSKAPLSILLNPDQHPGLDIRDEFSLRKVTGLLETMRRNAESEWMLRGAFPSARYKALLASTSRMLDAFHALHAVIARDLKASPGEQHLLRLTAAEREQLARRIAHLLYVLASSVQLEYPIADFSPEISHTRDRLLGKVFALRQLAGVIDETGAVVNDEDYELIYTYVLVTGQVAKEIETCNKEVEALYGTLTEDLLKLE